MPNFTFGPLLHAKFGGKFGMEEGTKGPPSMPNFTPIGAMCRPCGAENLKISL